MGLKEEERNQSFFRTLYYWAALFVTLTVVDDLTFGWVFWGISQFNLIVSVVCAFLIYWALGYWITLRGLGPDPGRVANWFLTRLRVGHPRDPELHEREMRLRSKITSIGSAVPMSLLFGGVLTTLWLRQRGVVDDRRARWLALFLCGLFALEVAAIHALGIGGLILWARHYV